MGDIRLQQLKIAPDVSNVFDVRQDFFYVVLNLIHIFDKIILHQLALIVLPDYFFELPAYFFNRHHYGVGVDRL
jgi:hypothetical protein